MLAACDVYRPAAIQQLQINGEKQGVEVFSMGDGCQSGADCRRRQLDLCQEEHGLNVVILDTAGRLHVDEAMMEELEAIKECRAVYIRRSWLSTP